MLGVGLSLDPREVPSPLIGQPVPAFNAPSVIDPQQTLRDTDWRGKVWVLNVWGSWCTACRAEHPVLMDFARRATVPIVGLNYKDKREDALRWLERFGDPYSVSLSDRDGRIGIDFGVYGAPETFVVDQAGVVRFKHVGILTSELITERIEPLIRQLHE